MTIKLSELEALCKDKPWHLYEEKIARNALPELLAFCRRARKLLTDYTFPCDAEFLGEYLTKLDGDAKKLLETIED